MGLAACAALVVTAVAHGQPCEVPDNGTGTADLPPPGCGYVSPDDLHLIIDGLPPGTTIRVAAEHTKFFNPQTFPGGNLGGEVERFDSILQMQMQGTGLLNGFNRFIVMQLACEAHTGPRNPGDPVQSFPNDMFTLQGQLFGDPDFDQLQIVGGTGFGLPSPGHTTLTQLPNGNFNVDSFFDITYQIDFVGAPGSILDGLSGSTQAEVRMSTGDPVCVADCAPPQDGNVDITDLLLVLADWGNPGPCDIDGNGDTDIGDLLRVLADWGPCFACPPLDLFHTVPDEPSAVEFGTADMPPIPADFFNPGSLPFTGAIQVRGCPQPFDNGQIFVPETANVDTIVQRSAPIDLTSDPIGSTATVDVEIIALSLSGIEPIQVQDPTGGSEPWLMAMGLSDNQQTGSMTVVKTHPTGGEVESATVPVKPQLVFAPESDLVALEAGLIAPDDVQLRILDYNQEGLPPVQMSWPDPYPWSTQPPADGGFFCPGDTFYIGNDTGPLDTGQLPPHVPPGSPGAAHFVCPPPPPPPGLCTYQLIGATPCFVPFGPICPGACPAPTVGKLLVLCPTGTPGCPVPPCPPFIMCIYRCPPPAAPGCICVAFYVCIGCQPC
jgi:hypothetical protein